MQIGVRHLVGAELSHARQWTNPVEQSGQIEANLGDIVEPKTAG